MICSVYATVTNNGLVIPQHGLSDFDLDKEKALVRRYQRRKLFDHDLVFEFTRDPALLHQYYRIRTEEYKKVYGIQMPAIASKEDQSSFVIVVRKGNFCVGGARLSTKNPYKNTLLPLEAGDLRIEKYFPLLLHRQLAYCQWGMIVLLPEFRSMGICIDLLHHIHNKAVALNCKMMFAVAPLRNHRLYQQNFGYLGLKATIHYDIKLPAYPHIEEIENALLSVQTDEFLMSKPVGFVANYEKYPMET